MNVSEAVARRASTRAYKPDPVPAAVVRALLEDAARAPSGGNLQPWRIYAVAGPKLDDIRRQAAANPMGEEPEEPIYPENLWDPMRTRRYESGEALYEILGIPRADKPARLRQLAQNGQMFGAPVGLFFCLPRKVGAAQWADIGMLMQTIMLLATERGLGACPQRYWARYHSMLAKALDIPADHSIFAGMALGYPDEAAPINRLRTTRDPFETWGEMIGFEP